MEYSKLVAVSGLPGLYELLNSKTDGAIVRSLDDRSTKFASSRVHQFSHLESIEIYTTRDNVNLVDVFQAMEKAGGSLPDLKDNGAIREYFEKTYPDMDFDRVYASDMKKMIKWFDVLKKNEVELKLSEPAEEEVEEAEEEATEPAKKTAKKKEEAAAGPKKETSETKETKSRKKAGTEEEAPKAEKKPAPKKSRKKAE